MGLTKRTQLEQPGEESTKHDVNVYCPQLKCKGSVSILKCLFRCPKSRVLKCEAYADVYPFLINFEIDEKYITKYGEVTIVVPMKYRKRRKRRVVK